MTNEEAIAACEFWTTNVAETVAIGSTRDPLVGLHFNGDEFQTERFSRPQRVGWGFTVPRSVLIRGERGEDPTRIDNPLYPLIEAEIERRRGKST